MPQTTKLPRISAAQFKSDTEIRDGVTIYPHAAVVKSSFANVCKEGDPDKPESLRLTWTISTEAVDRDGDTIALSGWDLKDFKRGGSVLWAHGHDVQGQVPIARPIKTFKSEGALKSIAEFTPKDLNPFGFMIYEMASRGFVRGSSVGFAPKEFKQADDRDGWMPMDFLKQTLLEWSVTPIPSNPEALLEAADKGIDLIPLQQWIEQVKDKEAACPITLTDRDLEIAYRCLSTKTIVALPGQAPGPEATPKKETLMEILTKEAQAVADLKAKADELVAEGVDAFTATLSDVVEAQKHGRLLSDATKEKLGEAKKALESILGTPATPAAPITTPAAKAAPVEPQASEGELTEEEVKEIVAAHLGSVSDQVAEALARIEGRAD